MKRRNAVPNTPDLPTDYTLHGLMDLKKDKKINISIQIVFVLIAALMVGLAILYIC